MIIVNFPSVALFSDSSQIFSTYSNFTCFKQEVANSFFNKLENWLWISFFSSLEILPYHSNNMKLEIEVPCKAIKGFLIKNGSLVSFP